MAAYMVGLACRRRSASLAVVHGGRGACAGRVAILGVDSQAVGRVSTGRAWARRRSSREDADAGLSALPA